jgi:hypothetical protein
MSQQVFSYSKLQVFHVDVAYITVAIHICCKYIVPRVSDVSDVCCTCFNWVLHMFHTYVWKCFIRMLYMFHTYVASILSGCCIYSATTTYVFPWCFIRMLQVFHLDVAKVDLMLHMLK